MKATILKASQATSGMSGINAPGIAVEAELSDGSNVRLYVRDGWATDKMAINGELKPVDSDIIEAIEIALEDHRIKLDMSYPQYLNWVPGTNIDYRYGTFASWQKLNGVRGDGI